MEGVAGRNSAAGLAIVNGEEAEVGAAGLAGDAKTPVGAGDVAGVEKSEGSSEVAGVLEEEGAEFGEIDGVALVDGELGLVAFDVAEIGVEGGVEDDGVAPDRFGFATGCGFGVAGAEAWIIGIELVEDVQVLPE